MGNSPSSKREKNRMREQINELTVMVHALQEELASYKTKSDERTIQIHDAANETYQEIRTCSERINVVNDIMDNSFGKLENNLQNYKERTDQQKIDFDESKRNFYKLLDIQERSCMECVKAVKNLQEKAVSLDEFAALSISFDKLKNRIDTEKEEVPTSVRKFLRERLSDLEKEILDIAEKFQETRGFMMELITLDLGHERDIIGLKYRVDKLEESSSIKLCGRVDDILPTPSLPEVTRIRSTSSEAPSVTTQESKTDQGEIENYQLKMSKISNVMKRMKSELHK